MGGRGLSRGVGSGKFGARGVALAAALGLVGALVGCGPASPSTDASYVIAGGGKSGVYYNYGDQLADAAQHTLGIDISVAQTQGSVENLRLVDSSQAVVGFAQGDTAADAVAGTGAFDEPLPITALARVYDEYVHIVVPRESNIEEITDLAGRTASLGAENSGVNVIATRVLEAGGVNPADVPGPALGLDASLAALQSGEIEAFFWVGGLPTPSIEKMAEELPIRLLEVEPEVVERVNAGHAGVYRPADVPAGAYGVDEEIATMAVPNYLIASEAAPPDMIRNLLGVLFDSRGSIATKVRAAAFLDRRQAIFTEPVPLHPGAAEYYRDARM